MCPRVLENVKNWPLSSNWLFFIQKGLNAAEISKETVFVFATCVQLIADFGGIQFFMDKKSQLLLNGQFLTFSKTWGDIAVNSYFFMRRK